FITGAAYLESAGGSGGKEQTTSGTPGGMPSGSEAGGTGSGASGASMGGAGPAGGSGGGGGVGGAGGAAGGRGARGGAGATRGRGGRGGVGRGGGAEAAPTARRVEPTSSARLRPGRASANPDTRSRAAVVRPCSQAIRRGTPRWRSARSGRTATSSP